MAAAPGADDDASGIAALFELARLLRDVPLRRGVLFAAFGLFPLIGFDFHDIPVIGLIPHIGVWPILYAFFDAQERLDRAAMRAQVEACIRGGAHGIAVLGLVTEFHKLTLVERRTVIDPKTGRTSFEVQRVPAFAEASQPGASYSAPSMDGSTPGIYHINLRNLGEMTRIDLPTQDFHEAVPGHHFQVALAQEQTEIPLLRRLTTFGAYGEGWALYTESLGKELATKGVIVNAIAPAV